MKLGRPLRLALYGTFLALAITGVAWLWLGEDAPPGSRAGAMKVHGLASMVVLVLLGAVVATHVPAGLRARKRMPTGITLLASNGVLAGTGYLLYYAGGEQLRAVASDVHVAVGFLALVATAIHAKPFARPRPPEARSEERGASIPVSQSAGRGAPRSATSSPVTTHLERTPRR